MKKLFTFALLALGGFMSVQADDYYLTGIYGEWGQDPNLKFTDQGDGIYTLHLDLTTTTGNPDFKILTGDWSSWLGWNNIDLYEEYNFITKGGGNAGDENFKLFYNFFKKYDFTYDSTNNTLKIERSEPRDLTFTVVGDSRVLGTSWTLDDSGNIMSSDNDKLVYTLTKTGVNLTATYDYDYKVVENQSWGDGHEIFDKDGYWFWSNEKNDWDWTNNYHIHCNTGGVYDVTFTLDINISVGNMASCTPNATSISYTLVGDAIFGGWSRSNGNELTDTNNDGTFEIKLENCELKIDNDKHQTFPSDYPFKIITDHDWNSTQYMGQDGQFEKDVEGNAIYTINETGFYDFTFKLTPASGNLEVIVNKVITLSSDFTTIASKHDLDWTDAGATAYYATVNNDNKVVLKKFEGKATSGTGLLLKRTGGDVVRPTIANTGGNAPANNKLVGVTDATTVGEGNNYVLSTKNSETGFYKLTSDVTIPAGKAYLHTDAALATVDPGSEARVAWVFEDEDNTTTGIEAVSTAAKAEGIFNLSGQRVAQPQKGLYIVNGKKVVMK